MFREIVVQRQQLKCPKWVIFVDFSMSAECPVKGVISGDTGSLLMMSSAAQFRLPNSRDESCGMNRAIINGMFDAPEQAAGGEGTRAVFNRLPWRGAAASESAAPFHPETNATRTRASTRKFVTAPAVLQQRD